MLGKAKENFNEQELNTAKEDLKNEVYRLKSQVDDLEEIVAEYRARISILEEEEEELISRIEEIKSEAKKINDENTELVKLNQEMVQDISKNRQYIVDLEEVHKELNEIINSSYEKIEELQNKEEGLKDDIIHLEKVVIVNKDLASKYETEARSFKGMLEIEEIKQSSLTKQAIALEQILESGEL